MSASIIYASPEFPTAEYDLYGVGVRLSFVEVDAVLMELAYDGCVRETFLVPAETLRRGLNGEGATT